MSARWLLAWGVGLLAAGPLAAGFGRDAAAAGVIHEAAAKQHEAELARRQGRPEAIAPLAALLALEDELPPGRLTAALRSVADGERSDPLVAAQAAFHLALEEDRRGDAGAARRRREALGFVGAFWVVGPFDAQGRAGLARKFPPEEKSARPSDAKFPGKEREVSWRTAPEEAFRNGALYLDALLRPDADGVAYALSYVHSDRARTAAVRIGSPGPIKVWMNGALALERNVVRAAGPDQDAAAVRLRKGANVLLVKTVVTSGAWRLYTRLTELDGRPLSGWTAKTTADGAVPAGGVAAREKARSLPDLLRRRAEAARGEGARDAWLDQARLLSLLQAEDSEARPLEAAAARAAPAQATDDVAVEALFLTGRLAREEDDRRAALERALAIAKHPWQRALALSALGDLARGRRREAAAVARWREALAADPACWPAAMALAFEEQAAGLVATALARVDALPPEVRTIQRVRRARARMLEALGRRADAEAELRTAHEQRRTDADLLHELALAARNRGDLRAAAAHHATAGARRPDLVFPEIEQARLLEALGDVTGARAVLDRALLRLPDEARLHEEAGKLLARAGQLAPAAVSLRRALVLRPQNPSLRRYLERLTSEGGGERATAADDLAKAHAADAESLAREVLMGKPRAEADGAIVLLDRRAVRVHPNGLSETFAQRVVQVRTDRAARDNQEFYVRYTPGSQEVEIRKARIFRRTSDGELDVSEATARDDRDLSEPWYGLYYDARAEVVGYEGLRPGDVLEVQYTVADVGQRNELADYFGDMQFIAETVPKRRWDYTLIGPKGRTFFFNDPKLSGGTLERDVATTGDETVHRFTARDVPKIETEPSMPGFAEVAPHLHVSTYRSWDDVGRWYWGLVEDQLTADDNIRRAAVQATAGARTDEQKVRALYKFVLEGTRYVGLEFGIHGYKPYKVTQVLARRFGDCKDKASLLYALLREVGIESELVLLRTRRNGRVPPQPASLAVFDHAIVYVPKLQRYLDGTSEFSGGAELPSQDQGVTVLRVGPRGSVLTETPVLPSSANRAARSWTVALEGEGGARIDERLEITGQAAPEWRSHYQTQGERRERYGKVWNGRYPGAELEELAFDGIEDRDRPVSLRARVQVPRIGELREGGELHLPVTAREVDFTRSYARLSRRKWELVIAYPWQHAEDLVYRLPDGWRVARLPAVRQETSAFGTFSLEVTAAADGRSVRVRSALDVHRHRIPPAEYAAFRAFLRVIDNALDDRVVLAKEDR